MARIVGMGAIDGAVGRPREDWAGSPIPSLAAPPGHRPGTGTPCHDAGQFVVNPIMCQFSTLEGEPPKMSHLDDSHFFSLLNIVAGSKPTTEKKMRCCLYVQKLNLEMGRRTLEAPFSGFGPLLANSSLACSLPPEQSRARF